MMSEDLLEQLGRIEREQRVPEAWDEVLDGRRSAEQVVRERAEAGDDEALLDALAEASAPVSDADRKAWARRIRAGVREASEEEEDDDSDAEPDVAPDDPSEPSPPIDLSERRGRSRAVVVLSAIVAVAAMLLLWSRSGSETPSVDTGPPLPAFSLVVRSGGAHSMRGADAGDTGPTSLRPESKIHWVVQPEQAVAPPLELATIVRGEGVTCLARPESVRASKSGALELSGTVRQALGLTPGRWTVELVVAVAGAFPGDREAGRCVHPRDLPCPCPPEVRPGATIDAAELDPERGAAAWRRVDSIELLVE